MRTITSKIAAVHDSTAADRISLAGVLLTLSVAATVFARLLG
jgi:hypothetical protein